MDLSREEIDRFIENNLLNFSINGSGWHNLIRSMLEEFCLAGWDLNEKVGGKEKFGGLRCYMSSSDENVNVKIKEIISKYTRLSGKTCEECGKEAKCRIVNSWETTLCFDHYLETINLLDIKNNDVEINGEIIGNINKIDKVETGNSLRETKIYFMGQEKYYVFNPGWLNYYLLLRSIPIHLFSVEEGKAVNSMFENLEDCQACGYKSLLENRCLRCYTETWNDSLLKYYDDKEDYIKICQMDFCIDVDDNGKLFQFDRSFEKLPNHKILFSDDEFKEHEKDIYD